VSEPPKTDRMIVTLSVSDLEQIVEAAVERALSSNGRPAEESRLLTPDEAAAIIGVKKDWLFRHGKRLPFVRRLS
jgi:hypothetical protein